MQDVDERYLADLQIAEIRNDFRLDDLRLGVPGVLLQSRSHVLSVKLIECGDADVERAFFLLDELPAPSPAPAYEF